MAARLVVQPMPQMPSTFRPTDPRSTPERKRDFEAVRQVNQPWRKWYSLKVWKAIRKRQLAIEPLCRRCRAKGEVIEATVVNHMVPHRGVWSTFVGGPFESVCKRCHDSEVQREERAAGLR